MDRSSKLFAALGGVVLAGVLGLMAWDLHGMRCDADYLTAVVRALVNESRSDWTPYQWQGSGGAGEQGSRGAGVWGSRGVEVSESRGIGEQGYEGAGEFAPLPRHPITPTPRHPVTPLPRHPDTLFTAGVYVDVEPDALGAEQSRGWFGWFRKEPPPKPKSQAEQLLEKIDEKMLKWIAGVGGILGVILTIFYRMVSGAIKRRLDEYLTSLSPPASPATSPSPPTPPPAPPRP